MSPKQTLIGKSQLGLILPGGGARAAYQVGVLRAVKRMLGRGAVNPFPVISGTSAGGINAVVLASTSMDIYEGITRMERIWANFHADQVMDLQAGSMLKSTGRWLGAISTGGMLVNSPISVLNNAPLRALLERHVRFARIQQAIDSGHLRACAITLSGYTSARSISFYQSSDDVVPWTRRRREGQPQALRLDHLMATSAIPFVFPPVKIRGEYFGDGSIRQTTPLSVPIRLGAKRLLVIGVRNEDPVNVSCGDTPVTTPSLGQIGGTLLDHLFSDDLQSDLERLERINTLIESGATSDELHPIQSMIIEPSVDLRDLAADHMHELPRSLKFLLKAIGAKPGSTLVSFLMFERGYTRALMDLGFQDATARRDELESFLREE